MITKLLTLVISRSNIKQVIQPATPRLQWFPALGVDGITSIEKKHQKFVLSYNRIHVYFNLFIIIIVPPTTFSFV
jgi:hypothetical protein